jgi:hypothetical protein
MAIMRTLLQIGKFLKPLPCAKIATPLHGILNKTTKN